MAGGIWLCCSSIGYLSKLDYEQEHEQEQDAKSFITQRFQDSDLPPLLNRYRNERAHDSEGRNDHDEEQQEKHHSALEPHCFEKLAVHVDPGLRVLRWLKKSFDCLFHALSAVGVLSPDGNAVQSVSQSV